MLVSSPRTWGCFSSFLKSPLVSLVFPTHVGVFLKEALKAGTEISLPHARGGVSVWDKSGEPKFLSSPRTWGCFYLRSVHALSLTVFPTHVGVFLNLSSFARSHCCLPHARGGVSRLYHRMKREMVSSPRTWGCFRLASALAIAKSVFPTHVGVFLWSCNY